MLWRLRRYIRKNYKPISLEEARKKKFNLSIIYAMLAWNLFGLLMYIKMKEVFPKTNSAAEYARFLGIKNASVVRVDGMKTSEEYDMHLVADIRDDPNWLKQAKTEIPDMIRK